MLTAKIKSIVLDKAFSSSISLQVIATIENDSANPVKFTLKNNEGTILEKSDNYVATPVEISKFYFLNDKEFFDTSSISIILEVEDSSGVKSTITKDIDTFQINNVSRTAEKMFEWSVRNFSTVPIYSMMQIFDTSGNVVFNSNEYRKPYGTSYNFYKYFCTDLNSLPDGTYFYRVKYYSKDEGWNRYYPSKEGIQFQVRTNEYPRLRMSQTKVRRESASFKLTSRIIFSDAEMDDIIYTITDNYGNILKQRTNYTYSPKIERLEYNYPLVKFNSSHLTVRVDVQDNLYGQSWMEEVIKLYSIYDLYRYRDKFRWKFRNYSNKNIMMQMEATDFNSNVVRLGKVMSMRDTFDYMQFEDPTLFDLPRDYYKFRLRVWCPEEDWYEYYPYHPMPDSGIQWTRRPHTPPEIEILDARIVRDLDDVKYLIFKANITDPENDPVMYELKDDAGTVIWKTRDPIDTPFTIDIKPVYDLIERSQIEITLTAEDDNGGVATKTVSAKAYQISGLKQTKGHIFNWKVDNHSARELKMNIEILKVNSLTSEKELIRSSNEYIVGSTIRPSNVEDRLRPKLTPGTYYYRLKVTSEIEAKVDYYPNEEGTLFNVEANVPPTIELDSLSLNRVDDSSFFVGLGGNINDKDYDQVVYSVKDQFKNVISASEGFVNTPVRLNATGNYQIANLNTARLVLTIDALDEGDALTTHAEIVNLFEIQNLYKDYDAFYWLFRNYSKMPVSMQIEILNHEGILDGAGEVKTEGTITQYRELRQLFNPNDYLEGEFFFRIKVWVENETWVSYYPNVTGIPFTNKHNHAPKITVISTDASKVGDQKYVINLDANITDKDGNKVYYVVKDDIN
jgi:CHU_C Type IX secretion signal domain